MAESRGRSKRLSGGQDRVWVLAMGAMAALMVVVVAMRWWSDRQPAEVRYGAPQIEVPAAAGLLTIDLTKVPALQGDGGVVSLKSGTFTAFVVRVNPSTYMVYGSDSATGRHIRYDQAKGFFFDQRDESVAFDKSTGKAVQAEVKDYLPQYVNTVRPDKLEIGMIPQESPAAETPAPATPGPTEGK